MNSGEIARLLLNKAEEAALAIKSWIAQGSSSAPASADLKGYLSVDPKNDWLIVVVSAKANVRLYDGTATRKRDFTVVHLTPELARKIFDHAEACVTGGSHG